MATFRIGQRVAVQGNPDKADRSGMIQGSGCFLRSEDNTMITLYLVKLDEGFYSEDRWGYTSVIAAHEDNLTSIEDT